MTELASRVLLRLAIAAVLASCAADRTLSEAREQFMRGQGAQALAQLGQAMREDPQNVEYRKEYFRLRELLVRQWLVQAETLRRADRHDAAEELYRRVRELDSGNARAEAGLAAIEMERRHQQLITKVESLVKSGRYLDARDTLHAVLVENPTHPEGRRLQRLVEEKTAKPAVTPIRLKPAKLEPVSLDLRDVTLRSLFDVIARTVGVSFVFDKDVRLDQHTTMQVRDAEVDELIGLVLATNQLQQKVINETTVLVYPNTAQKQREYQELVVKAFYVANADVKTTANMLRQLLKTRDIFVDESLGMIAIRDTPEVVRMAERLIAAQDLAEPEVMLEVEVLEISTSRLLELGVRFPDSLAVSLVGAEGTPGTVTLPEWLNSSSEIVQLSFSNPLFLLLLRQQDGSTRVLANPRIRVKNKEKARIHIGDRVPVITTTAAATGGFISESVTYLDVGLKLEVEPQIHLDGEVGIKVGLEVSNIAREVRGLTTGTLTYQIGTRNASTALRLKDGETQILAGLISDEDRSSANRVPGLGELPIVGRLFSQTRDSESNTEIVLLITPHVVRTLARPEAHNIEFAVGTEASAGGGGFANGAPPPPAPPTPRPAQPSRSTAPAKPMPAPSQPGAAPSPSGMVPFGGVRQESQ